MTQKKMKWVELTRKQAADYLAQTHLKRHLGTMVVNSYANDMTAGDWKADVCPPIVVTSEGALLDGNHRLTAFLASELETLPTWVLETDDLDAILTLDTGRPRSLADQLQLRGHANARYLQAMFNTAYRWKGGDQSLKLSRQAQIRWIETNPNAIKAAEVTASIEGGRTSVIRFPIGTVATLYDIACYAEGGDSVEEFVSGASHGSITFPILSRLQQKMADHSNQRNSFTMSPAQISYLTARVYMAWLNDETGLEKLYATRRTLMELPGRYEWLKAMWPERTAHETQGENE